MTRAQVLRFIRTQTLAVQASVSSVNAPQAAVVGFAIGLAADALTPAAFGSGALGLSVVAYLASWLKAVFFADNPLINAGFIAVGLWMRDLLVLAASGSGDRSFVTELALYSPLQALTTALFALVVLLAFREWFSIRLDA